MIGGLIFTLIVAGPVYLIGWTCGLIHHWGEWSEVTKGGYVNQSRQCKLCKYKQYVRGHYSD